MWVKKQLYFILIKVYAAILFLNPVTLCQKFKISYIYRLKIKTDFVLIGS